MENWNFRVKIGFSGQIFPFKFQKNHKWKKLISPNLKFLAKKRKNFFKILNTTMNTFIIFDEYMDRELFLNMSSIYNIDVI